VQHVEQLDALKMSCGNVAWKDVALTLTTEKVTDNPNYELKIKKIHPLTPEERQHLAGIMAIVNQSKARND
jgi:DNA replication initiation complex subunit (GINS family)